MMRALIKSVLVGALIAVTASTGTVLAQSAPQEAPKALPAVPGFVKVTIVVAHYQGEKRTSNLPYTIYTALGERTFVRTGSQIPVPSTIIKDGQAPVASFSYQSVGVNIDCGVNMLASSTYRLNLNVTDSWVSDGSGRPTQPTTQPALAGAPVIQSWQFTNVLVMRDGQTLQYTTATDKVTGEVVKIDVTLEVVK